MSSDLDDLFGATFNETIRSSLVDALGRAYRNAAEFHDPSIGSNTFTFGFNLWNFAVHELKRVAGESSGRVSFVSDRLYFRLRVGKFQIACHRVGRTGADNIWTAFPHNDGAVTEMVFQPYIPGFEPNLSEATRLVLAHMGNPEDCLCAAYLCIPIRVENGRIVQWGYVKKLYRADEGPGYGVREPSSADLAPEEIVPIVEPRLRADEETDAAQG